MGEYERFIGEKFVKPPSCGLELEETNPMLFPFQSALVKWALRRGRAAIFADTGLGKTVMQLEWAHHVCRQTNGRVLVLAPLCVAQQTVAEGRRFGIESAYRQTEDSTDGIIVTNYERMDGFMLSDFAGIVLDESSIIKHTAGKTKAKILDACSDVPYRLSCTATPAPNDHMELGNQAEFLGVMSATEMLATFFIHDGGDTSKWRLKGHGQFRFWDWLSTWAMVVKKPSDIGFSNDGYDLPKLDFHEHIVSSPTGEGLLFPEVASRLLDRNRARKESVDSRVSKCASIANATDEQFVVWCHLNEESTKLAQSIDGALEVTGSDSIETKEDRITAFTEGRARVLVTKPKIAGFGMNWQHVRNVAFVGLSDSWEQFYQAIRRCWRFGQTRDVNVHIVSAEAEGAVLQNIKRKEAQAKEVSAEMVKHMSASMNAAIQGGPPNQMDQPTVDTASGEGWEVHLGDCVDVYRSIPDGSVDYTIFSPPFASLYTYSDSPRDMGNSSGDDEFYEHFKFLVPELLRVTRPGRLLSFHCMNLPSTIQREGVIGLRDFRGELIRLFNEAGWIYHAEVCIWKDPVTAMQRTKALGLLHKQIKKDSSMSRMGIPDYVVTMRKPGKNTKPISHTANEYPVSKWQQVASPIWTDINPSRTLNKEGARESDDERHICPLQLDVIERCLEIWSAPDDLVSSPFTGIGSEGFCAVQMGRRFIGSELKRSYWQVAVRNLHSAMKKQCDLFSDEGCGL